MSALDRSVCFICEISLNEGEIKIVKEKGVKNLQKCSAKRQNEEHQRFLKDLKQVTIHNACHKRYINERMIAAYVRRCTAGDDDGPSCVAPSLRSRTEGFCFKDQCFLCGEGIPEDFLKKQERLPEHERNLIHHVMKLGVKETIVNAAENRGDEWGKKVLDRIRNVKDLVAVDAWYHRFCHRKLYQRPKSEMKRGHRPASNIDEAMETIYSYLENNSEECQFLIEDLMNKIEGDFRPDIRTVKSRLYKKYGEDVLIAETANKKAVVCFRNVGYKILSDNWYSNKDSDPQQERQRVVKAAADIILSDIRSEVYNTTIYPPSDNFLGDVESVIPDSLKLLMESIILKHKRGSLVKWKKTCIALSHSVINAVRPRSFMSSLLTGISGYLYRKFGSKHLIEILSYLGFSASYYEASLLETSAVLQPQKTQVQEEAFCQFVFDNADYNIMTIDGTGTFHGMGGIMCVTPHHALFPQESMKRLTQLSTAETVKKAGHVQLQTFGGSGGLQDVTIEDLQKLNPISNEIVPLTTDVVWLYSKWIQDPSVPGWNGFMEQITASKDYDRSRIICLPFINDPPTQIDTIYTSLLMASEKCKQLNQKMCFVTFDQPLYLKARDIVANGDPELNNIIVRLGGFHLAMSFMGAIGTIMAGSGLQQLLSTIYAENSVEKIMNGHAYSRAVRAHLLMHSALASLVWDTIEVTDCERSEMANMLNTCDQTIILTACANTTSLKNIVAKFRQALCALECKGPTAKLWLQYFRMITLLKQFIEAERTGNWKLHLDTVQKSLPFFQAAGHFLYAKSAHLYLQDMLKLEQLMDPTEFHDFTTKGKFTIRRSKKYWCGIWSDQTIEQTLMKNMKSRGGITRGRGFSDNVLAKWTLAMIVMQNICDEIENFCDIHYETSEQHVDMRSSRIDRDRRDSIKLREWLSQHPPFSDTDTIRSLSSGIVGGTDVNCHLAQEVGMEMVTKMVTYGNFKNVTFKRKHKVVTLASVVNSFKAGTLKVTAIDPFTLFQRLCLSKQSDEDLKVFLSYELAPYPMSLFSEEGMRKGNKSSLYKAFTPINSNEMTEKKALAVVDGGYLLHKVIWPHNASFATISQNYSSFLKRHYGSQVVVVFDGYPARTSTKRFERLRRMRVHCSPEVMFESNMINQIPQERFLANDQNKSRLIKLLSTNFEECGIEVKQAQEDADLLIVNTALSKAKELEKVVIVGEDIDLLVLMTALGQSFSNLFYLKPGRGSAGDLFFSTKSFKFDPGSILFIHAFSGCDTTSAIFGQGKIKLCNIVNKFPEMKGVIEAFMDPLSHHEDITVAGEQILKTLYTGDINHSNQSLDTLRFNLFAKSVYSRKINLARLPPTCDAGRYHSYRCYQQIQSWLGNDINPEQWGWECRTEGLMPVDMKRDSAPQTLLKNVSCACKKRCSGACSCRKAGLKCSSMCKNCSGMDCENVALISSLDETEEDDDLFQELLEPPQHGEKQLEDDSFLLPPINSEPEEPGPSKRLRRR